MASLTFAEQQNLRAVVDRVIPPDSDAGGADAGVHAYIEEQLSGDFAPLLSTYRAFLQALDTDTARFADLPTVTQDARLVHLEASEEWGAFFRQFVEHAQEGFYILPLSWQMVGWEVTG